MKTIKGFENEDIEVSDFGEWVGRDYIDYKFEYKNNQKLIKTLFKKNQKYKEVIDKAIKYIEKNMNQKLYTGEEFFETYSPVSDLLNILEEVE